MEDLKQALANGDISAESLVDRIEEQALTIERLEAGIPRLQEQLYQARKDLAALKAQTSGVVAWRVTGRGGITVTEQYPEWAEADCLLTITPLYARLNQPASAGDERVREALRECLEVMELHRLTGQVYANGRAALSANHSEHVRHMVTDSCFTCNGVGIVGHSILCSECAAPSAGSQKEKGE